VDSLTGQTNDHNQLLQQEEAVLREGSQPLAQLILHQQPSARQCQEIL